LPISLETNHGLGTVSSLAVKRSAIGMIPQSKKPKGRPFYWRRPFGFLFMLINNHLGAIFESVFPAPLRRLEALFIQSQAF
jgi:hypothetical protein